MAACGDGRRWIRPLVVPLKEAVMPVAKKKPAKKAPAKKAAKKTAKKSAKKK